MDINATLIGQSIAFFLFVWFVMRYIWPPMIKALNERTQRIADGLAAADRGDKVLAEAAEQSQKALEEARAQARDIVGLANRQASQLVEQARDAARDTGERIVEQARAEADREVEQARQALRRQVGELAVAGARTILKREIDAQAHAKAIEDLAAQL
jgi:ATP synthase F0 subcomplex B subunit